MNLEQLPAPPDECACEAPFTTSRRANSSPSGPSPRCSNNGGRAKPKVTPGVGGGYVFSWPDIHKTLRGRH